MNYNQEPFPRDITLLIQKCDFGILKIQESFSSPESLIVKDLYHQKRHKQKDFIQKNKQYKLFGYWVKNKDALTKIFSVKASYNF